MAGGGGGGETTSTTTTQVKPWEQAMPALEQGLAQLTQWFNQQNPYNTVYQGQTVAPFTDAQNQAFNMVGQNVANAGQYMGPVYGSANDQISRTNNIFQAVEDAYRGVIEPTMQGQYLNPESNPAAAAYLNAAIQPLQNEVYNNYLPQTRTSAEQAGRQGSGVEALQEGDIMNRLLTQEGNVAANMYNNLYNTERQNQLQAANYPANLYQFQAGQLPSQQNALLNLLNQGYTNAGYLSGVGETQQALNQAMMQDAQNRFYQGIYNPLDLINAYLQSAYQLGGGFRTSGTTLQQPGQSLAQQLIGGAGAAAGVAGNIPWNQIF